MRRCLSALLVGLAACASAAAPQPRVASAPARFEPSSTAAIEIPTEDIPLAMLERKVVARGLRNPRGMLIMPDGSLLVAEAGSGAADDAPDGTLALLTDRDGDGDFLDDAERKVLLDRQPSKSLLDIVHRDEVVGMAGVAAGGHTVLAALASFGGPSTLFRVDGDAVSVWAKTHDDIDDLAYDPQARQWFAVASSTDEVVRLQAGGGTERVLQIPPLPGGQDPLPGCIHYDRLDGHLLVGLFGGSPRGQAGGRGHELVARAGAIISVAPASKRFSFTVRGLTAPADFAIASDASLYVLELCDAFVDPAPTRAALLAGPSHGGLKRFSGRLLRVDRMHRRVTLIASELDTPTNLVLGHGDRTGKQVLYIAEGLGTPGRPIPGPDGVVPLTGFIERMVIEPGREIDEDWP
jgi:hypothetical protein